MDAFPATLPIRIGEEASQDLHVEIALAFEVAVESAMEECMVNAFFDASTFKQVLKKHAKSSVYMAAPQAIIKLLDPSHVQKAETRPASSDINLYENLFNIKPQ